MNARAPLNAQIPLGPWRGAGAEPVPVAPSYTKFVNEHMFPTSGADLDSACAVDGVCGEATGMVGRCRLPVSKPVLKVKARLVSTLEAII